MSPRQTPPAKAPPAAHTDAARGFTASTVQFCRDVFSHFKDMPPACPWRGVSVKMARNALNVLAVDLKATNSLRRGQRLH